MTTLVSPFSSTVRVPVQLLMSANGGSYKDASVAAQKRLVRRLFRHASAALRQAAAAAAIDEKKTPQLETENS